jgi:site-specific DNA-methyltransferase (adenine-specific)
MEEEAWNYDIDNDEGLRMGEIQETLDGSEYIYEMPKTKRKNPPLYTSMSDNWRTPESFFNKLNEEFCFDFDPCPYNERPEFDGLRIEWGQSNFVNPPYSNWQEWIDKGYREFRKGKTVVFLLAARTDTAAFHDIILPYAKEIRFIRGRLKFIGEQNTARAAPFPSVVVIFK